MRALRSALPVLVLALLAAAPARADWTATGVFQYADRVYGPGGFTGATANLPIRRAVVQVLDATTGSVLASGGTDATGAFSLNVPDAQTRNVYVRALTYAADSTLYRLRVASDPGSGSLFAVASAAVNGHAPTTPVNFNGGAPMVAPMRSVGEAFNILDCLENGVDYLAAINRGARPSPSQALVAYWNLGTTDGTYYTGGTIHLTKDDAYSDPVINHEQGHYMAAMFSRDDSPGGTHYLGDNTQDLRLSFSEGWATYFGQSVRRSMGLSNPSWYCDLFGEAADPGLNFSYEIETPGIGAIGAASEVSVEAALWDIVDADPAPDISPPVLDDSLALPDTLTWDVMRRYMPVLPGGQWATLEGFWDGWFARGWGHPVGLISIFQRERVEFYPDGYENDNFAVRAAVGVTDGTPTRHTIYPGGDADWVRFPVSAGQAYVVETTGLVGGCDTYLQVYFPDTLTQAGSNDNRAVGDPSSRVNFTAPSTGTAYVKGTRVGLVGRYGSYDLRVTAGTPTAASFTNVTTAAGVSNGGNSRGVAWGDYNNDGYPDLYVCNTGAAAGSGAADRLYRNNAGANFTDVTASTGTAAGTEQHEGAAWADFNNDGNLDLVVVSIEGIHLFRNGGPAGYTFTDVAATAGLTAGVSARSVSWVDFDGDGYTDLYVTSYGGTNRLWRNNGDGTFTLVTRGVEFTGYTFTAAWCDYDQDGRPDVALGLDGDVAGEAFRLFRQKSDGSFEDVSSGAGLAGLRGRIFGLAWGDYDGDGVLDLAAANQGGNNYLFHSRGNGTFVESAFEANVQGGLGGASPAWLDADDSGNLDLYVVNFNNPASLFDNLNGRSFTTSGLANVNAASRAVAAADYDRNGAMDLYVATQSSNTLYRGTVPSGRHWLELTLRGRQSNRSGIGARVVASVAGRHMTREVSGGQAWGSQPSAVVHLGLGTSVQADSVRVVWPSRKVTLLTHVTADQVLAVDESTSVADSPGVPPPGRAALWQNTPNPFNPLSTGHPTTAIRFDVPVGAGSQAVKIAIYDVLGRLETVLLDELRQPGAGQTVRWNGRLSDGRLAPDGLHLCRLSVGSEVRSRKIMVVSAR
ncbi:MAG: VCBS repeat-containing protein [Candidatus Eisenbacteria bacterium]|nr:VCBS repeat-containing protein [Candidatus Eisenbacteria bacterium]